MKRFYWLTTFIFSVVALWPLGCTREGEDEGNDSYIKIKVPAPVGYQKGDNFSSSLTFQSVNPGGWNLTDPTTLDDVLCYAVAVEGPEDFMSKYSCTQIDTTVVMTPAIFGGPVIPDSEIELTVPSGSERTFYILGFGATDVEECLSFTLGGIPPRENMSAPHIIGTKTVDLVPGELNLDISISMNNAVKFNECSGPFFNPDPAELTITESPIFDFGDRATGSTTDHTFTLENIGGSAATSIEETGLAAPYSLKGGSWPGTGGTCADSIASAATCTIVVEYAPTVVGTPTDTITVEYYDGYNDASVERDLTGIANLPATLTFADAPSYDFGIDTLPTMTETYTFTVTNTGDYEATAITETALPAPFDWAGGTFPGTAGDCDADLNPMEACTIEVEFAPATDIVYNGTIEFNYIDGAFPAVSQLPIQGEGATPAVLAITPDAFDYGTRATGSTTAQVFTVTNSGDWPASGITETTLAAPFAFVGGSIIGSGTCVDPIPVGTCTIAVEYSPVGVGAHGSTITLNYNDGLAAQIDTETVSGTGALPASLDFTDADPLAYGAVTIGLTSDYTFTLQNSGGVPATGLSESTLGGDWSLPGGYPGTGGDCTGTLNDGLTCEIVARFTPATPVTGPETITIDYNDGANPQSVTHGVTGSGDNPAALTISGPATVDFGDITIGNTANYTFNVDNTGDVAATGITETSLPAEYAFAGGSYPGTGGTCTTGPNDIAGGANCDIVVTYTPAVAGTDAGNLTLNFNNGVSGGVTSVKAITGDALDPASLSISPGGVNYGNITIGQMSDFTFTINNTGDVAATGITETGLAAPYQFKGGSYPGTGGTCTTGPNDIAAASGCTMVVTYTPPGAAVHNDTFVLDYNNGVTGGNTATRSITGTGVTPALLTITPGSHNYGSTSTGVGVFQNFTVTNSGDTMATSLTHISFGHPDYSYPSGYPGSGGGDCGSTVPASGGSCIIRIEFNPGTTGVKNGTIDLQYDDGSGGAPVNATNPITGTGT